METNRLRIRSEAELELQQDGLDKIFQGLAGLGVEAFLSGGTLLGAVRANDFIPWDWDVAVSVRLEEILPVANSVRELLEETGFSVKKFNTSRTNWKLVLTKDNAIFELKAFRRFGSRRLRRDYFTFDQFFQGTCHVMLRGRKYRSMCPPEAYLEHAYGRDWQTPVRTDDKEVYISRASWRARRHAQVFAAHRKKQLVTLLVFIRGAR